ncbi:SAM-dependent methyltransferase [Shewanella hanedai]|uniref:tRNA (adenine(22)-N(1))-methyltransferase TrmK n=1 Tax=Shewanella hanedai TaxID=25 RepID=UPI00198B0804|nr:tRNA (adenine(22)-N(1))-methyltransferase TrmK [Shewanella hanedai]GGJ03261.1 SAM-dependent methyltransferase [Shewanella hanedai]
MSVKLSQRLGQIDTLITRQYDHIWDCCCDHGLLGAKLLQRDAASNIHFVDMVDDLMAELERKLMRFFPQSVSPQTTLTPSVISGSAQWLVHCIDVAQLPLDKFNQHATHLIIIAGVGGELLVELVQTILSNHGDKSLEFILCPVHHNYKVRSRLIEMKLGLIQECLVKENNRFYEIMHLSSHVDIPLVKVGSQMWNFEREEDRQYLAKTILHYQRMSQHSRSGDLGKVMTDYQQLEINHASVSMA